MRIGRVKLDSVWKCSLGLALVLAFLGREAAAAERLACFATVPPVAKLVEQVGGENVTIHVLVPPGQSPHTFSPKPRSMVRLARSQLYFAAGLPFEKRIISKVRSIDADLTIVPLDAVLQNHEVQAGKGEGKPKDGHDHHGHHEHGTLDPHIWMSPVLAMDMAERIAQALIKADPQGAEQYRTNLQALQATLKRLHQQIGKTLKPYEGKTFYVFHPAFGHFAQTYGLTQRAVEISGRSPTPRELRAFIQQAKAEEVRILFVQPQFESSSARSIAKAINGSVVRLDPLSKDLLENFETIARKLRTSFADE